MTHIEEKNGKMGLVKKPTGYMTSSNCIAQALNVRCIGGHDHVPLVGGRAVGAAIYPKMLCQAIVNGVNKQKVMDASLTVDTVKTDKGQLSSFAIGICSDLRRGRISVRNGGCSSVVRGNGVNRPVGKWPSDWVHGVHDDDGGDDHYGVRPSRVSRHSKKPCMDWSATTASGRHGIM